MDDFSDTLGAGSYPSPEPTHLKEYLIEVNLDVKAYVSVIARDLDEAEDLIETANYSNMIPDQVEIVEEHGEFIEILSVAKVERID